MSCDIPAFLLKCTPGLRTGLGAEILTSPRPRPRPNLDECQAPTSREYWMAEVDELQSG
ncbi:hypothetical protein EX30DRAFT_266221 [Ascodesmis nigricans]|uniref:Uncharacterized protein n=1 Tax=Ascodesmis nigricans TaxID=341454 RepID=A0A4S2MHA9_9PEZI|nr:hypothetical protein EX30DRAFT_266221 [Ascodesmis nigricans]